MSKTLRRLYKFHWKYQKWLILSFFLTTLIAITSSVYPYFYEFFIDTARAEEFGKLPIITIFFLVLVFVDNILDPLISFTFDKHIFRSMRDARIKIFQHVQDLDFAFHTEKNTGSLISAFKRGDGAFWNLSAIFRELYLLVIQFIVLLITFWLVSFKYTLIALVLLGINLIAMKITIPLNIKRRKEYNKEEDEVSGIITENWLNYDTVKFFAKEQRERENIQTKFEDWMEKLWGYSHSFRLIDFVGTFINISGYAAVLYFLTSDLTAGTITIGTFVLVLGFLNNFFPRLRRLLFRFRNIAKNFADLEKYFGLLDEDVEIKDPKNPITLTSIKGKISFEKVTFSYDKNKPVLEDIDITFNPGESVALVGRSGAGKTTITKLILRFYDPDEGKILLDETDVRKLRKADLRSFMGVVPQEPILFNNTIGYNIGYGNDEPTQKLIEQAAEMAYLDEFIASLPNGYETLVGERGIKLSGGQRQRLAIARMIMANPEIIIFDEATSNLDSEAEKKIQDAFWKVAKDKTTIIIAHRFSTIQKADRIVVLDNGRVVEQGTHSELIQKEGGIYKQLWDLQTGDIIDE